MNQLAWVSLHQKSSRSGKAERKNFEDTLLLCGTVHEQTRTQLQFIRALKNYLSQSQGQLTTIDIV